VNENHRITGIKIKRILQVSNPPLLRKYEGRKQEMIRMNLFVPKGFVNEHRLFHGSTAAEQIAQNGFDLKYSSKSTINYGTVFKKY